MKQVLQFPKSKRLPQARPLQAWPCEKAAGIDGEEAQRVKRGVGRKLSPGEDGTCWAGIA